MEIRNSFVVLLLVIIFEEAFVTRSCYKRNSLRS